MNAIYYSFPEVQVDDLNSNELQDSAVVRTEMNSCHCQQISPIFQKETSLSQITKHLIKIGVVESDFEIIGGRTFWLN